MRVRSGRARSRPPSHRLAVSPTRQRVLHKLGHGLEGAALLAQLRRHARARLRSANQRTLGPARAAVAPSRACALFSLLASPSSSPSVCGTGPGPSDIKRCARRIGSFPLAQQEQQGAEAG